MRCFFVAIGLVALIGCGGEEHASTTAAHGRGIAAQLPNGWQATRTILTPQLADPRQAFAAATYPLRYRRTECAHVPGSALQDLGPHDAFVELEERGRGAGGAFPPRPARFGPGLGTQSEADGCVSQAVFREHWFGFEDGGRRFHVRVAFGPRTTAETQDEAWTILDSLRIDRDVGAGWKSAG